MIADIKTDLAPLCDRGHGRMRAAQLVNEFNDRSPCARCAEPSCWRIYTPLNGYRDLEGDGRTPPRDWNKRVPHCKEHHYYWMYAYQALPTEELRFACPAEGAKPRAL